MLRSACGLAHRPHACAFPLSRCHADTYGQHASMRTGMDMHTRRRLSSRRESSFVRRYVRGGGGCEDLSVCRQLLLALSNCKGPACSPLARVGPMAPLKSCKWKCNIRHEDNRTLATRTPLSPDDSLVNNVVSHIYTTQICSLSGRFNACKGSCSMLDSLLPLCVEQVSYSTPTSCIRARARAAYDGYR